MFAKLFKYEMKAVSRIFLIAWPALLALALFNGFFLQNDRHLYQPLSSSIMQTITMFAFVMLFAAVLVMTLIVIIMRFYKGLLRDEGYLMFTLPVTTRQIITAKGISATILALVATVVGTTAIFLLVLPSKSPHEIAELFSVMQGMLAQVDNWGLYLAEIIVVVIVTTMASIYLMYAAMSLGQLAQKHKIAWSFAAYVGISIILSIITWIFGIAFPIIQTDMSTYTIDRIMAEGMIGHWLIFGYIVTQVLQIVVFHAISEYTLDKKLNLE